LGARRDVAVVGIIVWLWRYNGLVAVAIGGSILMALCAACFFGLTVPALLHTFKLDPKIAAGPQLSHSPTSSRYCSIPRWPLCCSAPVSRAVSSQ
jgi:hypothetical protein